MKFENLKKSYKGRVVLDVSALELQKGKVYAVIGANGSGKSTLAKVIAGIVSGDGGKQITNLNVGYLPQKAYAFNMTTKNNILVNVVKAKNEGKADIISSDCKAEELMKRLNIDHLAESKAKGLSGGEAAKMALARIMMKDYELLILDEATAAMDAESTMLAEELVKEYRERIGCTVVVITHSLNQAKRLADEAIYMEGGEIIEVGKAFDILTNPKDERTKKYIEFFGA